MFAIPTLLAPILAFTLATSAPAAKTPAAKPLTARQLAAHKVSGKSALPWIDDDWPRAVAEAKARKVPIFVESWAPW